MNRTAVQYASRRGGYLVTTGRVRPVDLLGRRKANRKRTRHWRR